MAKMAAARRLKLWPGYQFIVSVWFPKVESETVLKKKDDAA